MFLAQRLLYVEMHKTGSTHILDLLARTIPGRQMGKHNRPRRYPADRLVITSVRNPWAWYLSLWGYGCTGRGALHHRLTGTVPAVPGNTRNTSRAGEGTAQGEWRALYADPDDPARFREWLHRIHDPANAEAIGEGYEHCPFNREIGLCTFRFLHFALDDPLLLAGPGTKEETADPADLYRRHNAIDRTIRTETLAGDLLEALAAAGYALDENARRSVRRADSRPANRSIAARASACYDTDTIRLVAERERVIIDNLGYGPPG